MADLAGGFAVAGFVDWHVHLLLQEPEWSPVTRVVDLGAPLGELPHLEGIDIQYAGQFMTAVGGYPSDREWAPDGSYIELTTVEEARSATRAMLDGGANIVKVSMNRDAGPVLPDDIVREIVRSAGDTPVIAHAEGAGEAARARECGATMLAHTPFTETLSDAEIRAQAASMTWISTLDIHGWGEPDRHYGIAIDNLRRFHEAGGTIRYGTDMGNGPTVPGFNHRELDALADAGLTAAEILGTLTPISTDDAETLVYIPGKPEEPDLYGAERVA